MIQLKNPDEIDLMERSGHLVAECLMLARERLKPGITTAEINHEVEEFIEKSGADAAFKGFPGPDGVPPFPAACCMSVDQQVVHGIPNDIPLKKGQILSVDIGVKLNGWYGDSARTFIVGGESSPEVQNLVSSTLEALEEAIELIRPGEFLSNIGYTIQSYVEKRGFSVVRDLVGHGIGRELHEPPQVPNFGRPNRGLKLREGMVIAVEPMINMGVWEVRVLRDGWTIVTKDGEPSAHFEHTIAVTANGPRVLTPDPS